MLAHHVLMGEREGKSSYQTNPPSELSRAFLGYAGRNLKLNGRYSIFLFPKLLLKSRSIRKCYSPASADERPGVCAALRPDRQVRHRRHDDIHGGQEERETDGRKGAPIHDDGDDDDRGGGGVEGRAGGGDGGQVHPGAEGAEVPLPRNLLLNEHVNLQARA